MALYARTPSTAVLTIVDTTPSVQFDRPEYVVEERAGTATLTVMRSGPDTGTVTVRYATTDIPVDEPPAGHALAGSDYRAVGGVLTFRPGERSKTIAVPIVLDLAPEDTESFRVVLSDRRAVGGHQQSPPSSRSSTTRGRASCSSRRRLQRARGNGSHHHRHPTGGTDGPVTVGWSVTGGTATPGADYTPSVAS